MTGRHDDPRGRIAEDDDLQELYGAEYLQECAAGTAREERLAELRRRIEHGAYQVDSQRIAEEILARGDLGEE
jgi:anti-sigma28 factor (negative regulator of flagellin synthesis)